MSIRYTAPLGATLILYYFTIIPVSYTHLDVYKRQGVKNMVINIRFFHDNGKRTVFHKHVKQFLYFLIYFMNYFLFLIFINANPANNNVIHIAK